MDSFVEYQLELLEPLGAVRARGMFGGYGLYLGGRMFALIAEGRLYLKVDDMTRPAFQSAGCEPFVYTGAAKPVAMSYWTPPRDAEDDSLALLPWARRAVEAAQRAAAKKAPAAKKASAAKKTPAAKKAPSAKKRTPRVKRS
ncbi:TfoX/Sxy family protein [Myxococcaceae bacterium GXIMD 01537]